MSEVSTRPQVGATGDLSPSPIRPAAHSPETIEFDSSAFDVATMRTTEIGGLASCMMCLTAVGSSDASFNGYELTEDALPLLGAVIMRLAREADQASHQLWSQYKEARAAANGREVQQ
ncbi:hypothetical protein FFI97_001720 [Variovorax sp. KBS0712]|uniref:hypothetical protein n=1 Tax=Variovorax sp. KBS0712 TaxID=2578111 RepID=UPI00111B90B7|nr:hypothetical protein [Variovorax sp. KBS0712]TSD59075.1 hypothetical protein FFI97_001720 [Variovorax sp. KBS0712]